MKKELLKKDSLKIIKDFALKEFNTATLDYRNVDHFLCLCYMQGMLIFLETKGYEIVKKELE